MLNKCIKLKISVFSHYLNVKNILLQDFEKGIKIKGLIHIPQKCKNASYVKVLFEEN